MELSNPLRIKDNMMLESSKEALQEALLMLYSVAYTLGPNVHLVVKSLTNGVWFRIRYSHTGEAAPYSLNDLLERLKGNWRLEDTAFELRLANDFITLSGSKIHFQSTEHFCELAFFVYAVGKRPPDPLKGTDVNEPPPITETRAEEILLTLPGDEHNDLITHRFSEQELNRLVEKTVRRVFGDEAGEPVAASTPPEDIDPDNDDTVTPPTHAT